MMNEATGIADFKHLTPEVLLDLVEEASGIPMTGLTMPLPSYINRVYELQARRGERIIAKFYRPGRWSRIALEDEHRFLADCAAAEIPVVCPLPDSSRSSPRNRAASSRSTPATT